MEKNKIEQDVMELDRMESQIEKRDRTRSRS
jgi:hypothetical protein